MVECGAGNPPAPTSTASASTYCFDIGNSSNRIQQTSQNSETSTPTWTKVPDGEPTSGERTPISSNSNRVSYINCRLEKYFRYLIGPRDLDAHSKLPHFVRFHGSVMPQMIVPLMCIGIWATVITVTSKNVKNLGVSTILLTVLGFVVGLALSFRSTTAYERYSEGRKAWATIMVQSRNFGRVVWHNIAEPNPATLLMKITAINLTLAFSVALKHQLRFEPYINYPDLVNLVGNLDTFAKAAYREENMEEVDKHWWKRMGEVLELPYAMSNPKKTIKRAKSPLGNLPVEILNYLSDFVQQVACTSAVAPPNVNQRIDPVIFTQLMNYIASLADAYGQADRVLTTPLPLGYNILISQIVILYVYLLPFQLFDSLGWMTIPGTLAGAYIILGIAAIGNQLENPFGNDVNDLPLDSYCEDLRRDLDYLVSKKPGNFRDAVYHADNKPLWPLEYRPAHEWNAREENEVRAALKTKVLIGRPILSEARKISSNTNANSV